jgi:tetratricopeptide (TPR) repeat protein
MSSICFSIGFPDDTFELLKEGENFAKELGDDKKLSQLYYLIRYYYVMKGNIQEAISYGEDLYKKAVEINDPDLTVSTAFDLCFNYYYTGQLVKLVQSAQKILSLIEREDRQTDYFGMFANPYISISGLTGYNLGNLGDFETGIVYCEKGLEVARKINEPLVLGVILNWYGMMYAIRGDGTLAVKYLEPSVKHLKEANEFLFRGIALGCLCRAHLFLGDRASSRNAANESLAIANEYDLEVVKAFVYYAESLLFCDEGDFKQAFVVAEKALTIAQNSNSKFMEMQYRLPLGKIVNKLNTSEYDDAKNHILRGIMISEEMQAKPYTALGYLYLGEIDYDSGRNIEAHHNLKKAETMFKEMGMLYWLNMAQTLLERL